MSPAAPILFFDSGVGGLSVLGPTRALLPNAPIVYCADSAGFPYGTKSDAELASRVPALLGRLVERFHPRLAVIACNTASTIALDHARAALDLPIVGTVPAIKPAAAGGGPVAIWATPATTGSPYQRNLIAEFADGVAVTEVPCPGLADAVHHADETAIGTAIAAAAALTPDDVSAVVLGCTNYELVADRIRAAVQQPGRPPLILHGSAGAVAAQSLRRIGAQPAPEARADSTLAVLLSGRLAELPATALSYEEGRLLQVVSPAR
jgi:glutamate racemase